MEHAKEALQKEDQALHDCFARARRDRPAAYGDVAHGLTYWLFESTLVYTIFRAWIPHVDVAWEHATGENRLDAIHGKGGCNSQKCDLVVFEDHQASAAYEAKWWNSNGKRAGDALLADAAKLRRNFPNAERVILAFWWGAENRRENDWSDAKAFCEQNKFELIRGSENLHFSTKLRGDVAGYFALAGMRVR